MLLYSTCTFDRRENEDIIAHLLEEYPEFRIMDMESYEGFTPGLSEEAADGEERHLEKTVRIFLIKCMEKDIISPL